MKKGHVPWITGKKGFIPWNKGIKFTQVSGEKSVFWKGGVTPIRTQIRSSLEMKKWIRSVFERDNYTCQSCGRKRKPGDRVILEAHHLKTFSSILDEYKIKTYDESLLCESLWDISNGQTLCRECHHKTKFFVKKST